MSRLKSCFSILADAGRTALIPYITAGDPDPKATVPLMHAMVAAGADILELGVPFSDPMADGPVIQRASERALEHHTGLTDVLHMVSEFRQQDSDTPIVLMGYLNPVEVMGYKKFAEAAAKAGVDGVLTVDLPPEEGHDLIEALASNDLEAIFLIAPTSTDTRIQEICAAAGGFVYYVSLKGVTGAANLDIGDVKQRLAHIRTMTTLPLGVGFGIKDDKDAAAFADIADAVVVGSAVVRLFEGENRKLPDITQDVSALLSAMRTALDKHTDREYKAGSE
jgi:tryptophan synthase alpha chain